MKLLWTMFLILQVGFCILEIRVSRLEHNPSIDNCRAALDQCNSVNERKK